MEEARREAARWLDDQTREPAALDEFSARLGQRFGLVGVG